MVDTSANSTATAAPRAAVDLSSGNDSSSTLELVKVKKSDAGTYECVAILADSKEISIKIIYLEVSK